MDNIAIGRFIMQKRKEQNLTQEKLAKLVGVSNKTVSKWETGKCMPDYSIVEKLCEEVKVTLAELLNGEEDEKSIHTYDSEQMIEMLMKTHNHKEIKMVIIGCMLIIMSIAMFVISKVTGGTEAQNLLSGFMFGISIPQMLFGIFFVFRSIWTKKRKYVRLFL